MSTVAIQFVRSPWGILPLAIVLAGSSFLLQARSGINLADEGFLWYGVQRTARGAVPLRDFQAYDPGRYYWSAAATLFLGRGLLALRFSEMAFQVIGLWVALLAANRVAHNWALLLGVGVMLTLWMFPSHKFFDCTLLLCGIWIAVRLIEAPSSTRIFAAGIFIGLCVFFGRNHALYNFLAQASLLLLLRLKLQPEFPISHLGIWVAGIIVGLAPLLVMFAAAHGLVGSYLESIRSIFRHGTNLALAVPWPWRVWPTSAGATQFLLGIFLVLLPLAYVAIIGASLFLKPPMIKDNALVIACGFVGLFYLHHAFSRADISHLAQVIFPFALAALALPALFRGNNFHGWAVIAVLIAAALVTVGRQQPIYQRLTARRPWESCDVGGKILVPPNIGRLVDCLRKFASDNIAPRESVLIVPFTPALYPLLNLESPLWELAYYVPSSAQRQEAMIRELAAKNVNWVIISDLVPDRREDLRFSASHNRVWQYLTENFEPAESACLQNSVRILHRKNAVLIPL